MQQAEHNSSESSNPTGGGESGVAGESDSGDSQANGRSQHASSAVAAPAKANDYDRAGDSSTVGPQAAAEPTHFDQQTDSVVRWNFWTLAWYQVILRIGWIFKTESIIMPAVLDSLGCGPVVRAWLPLFNRFGQSVPPLLLAHRVRGASHKKKLLSLCAFLMSLSFLVLAACWRFSNGGGYWLPYVFIGIYALFFVSTGVHQLCFGSLQGKLVPVRRRGRLLMASSIFGASSACLLAALLLPRWLSPQSARFDLIFAFTGVLFLIASLAALLLKEHEDNFGLPATTLRSVLSGAGQVLRAGPNVRRLALVASFFGASVILFPHYQAIARERLGLSFENMMVWVVIQNAGTAIFSFFVGPLADRKGNRLVLLFVLAIVCISPLMAIGLSYSPTLGPRLFPLVFLFVGLTPNIFRTFNNYTLEISEPADHPRFLSTISLFIAAPALLSPLVGQLATIVSMDVIFVCTSLLLFCGWLAAFGLEEPRAASKPPAGT